MNKVDAEFRGVARAGMADVVAELILLLITLDWEGGDAGDELIVAESLESAGCNRGCREGKRQRKTEIRIPDLVVLENRRFRHQRAQPLRTKSEVIAQEQVVVIRTRGKPRAGQRPLLHEIVVGEISVKRIAQEPVRALRLPPVEARVVKGVTKGHRHGTRHIDGSDARDLSGGGESG